MFATFAITETDDPMIWWFSRIYLYLFIALFIYVVLSLFISIIMDSYDTIKEYYEQGFPLSDLQVCSVARYVSGVANRLLIAEIRRGMSGRRFEFHLLERL